MSGVFEYTIYGYIAETNRPLTQWGWDEMAGTLADDTFKYKFANENALTSTKKISEVCSQGSK